MTADKWPLRRIASHVYAPICGEVQVPRAELECGHRSTKMEPVGTEIGCWACSRAGRSEATAPVADPVLERGGGG